MVERRLTKAGYGIPAGSETVRERSTNIRHWKIRTNTIGFFGIWLLIVGYAAAGCTSEPTRSYGKEVVTTYAQLTLLYEKEKMVNKVSDSLYQAKVKDFFQKKGIEEKVFRKGVEEFSRDERTWKLFIQDVSLVMDSLKSTQH
jgi:hypothetical protein